MGTPCSQTTIFLKQGVPTDHSWRRDMASVTINKYLQDLAAKKPVPGGGSSAALVGALGVALIEKACNFTIGKEKFKAVEKDMRQILKKAIGARKRLVKLVELDKQAFLPVAKAYKLPRETDEQKAARKERIALALKEASRVPAEIKRICNGLLEGCDRLEKDGNQLLVGDVRCARELLKAAGKGAENFIQA
jgi:formiminotetrahydrofolate cyclodeaminase